MRKILIMFAGLSLLLIAAAAFARPWGPGPNAAVAAEQKQFFDATKDLRKEMHDKMFQMKELYRSGADQAQVEALQKEMDTLRAKIQAKAQELGISNGPGACNNQGADCNMRQGRGPGRGAGCNNGPCANGQQAFRGCGPGQGRCAQ